MKKNRPPAGARREPAAQCAKAHKLRFDTPEAARGAAIARVKRDGRAAPLAVYECEDCGGWHHTSSLGRGNRAVPGRRERLAWSQEKLDRVLALVRDANGLALTALVEYPKGALGDVLALVQEADREGRAQLESLSKHDLDSPELRAAVDGLRPKLRAMEWLAREPNPGVWEESVNPGLLNPEGANDDEA